MEDNAGEEALAIEDNPIEDILRLLFPNVYPFLLFLFLIRRLRREESSEEEEEESDDEEEYILRRELDRCSEASANAFCTPASTIEANISDEMPLLLSCPMIID